MKRGKLPSMPILVCLLLCMDIINRSSFARTLGSSSPSQHHHKHHKNITFLMQNVLNATHPPPKPATAKVTSQIPFPKPLGYFPPIGGIPLQQPSPAVSGTGLSTQTLDVSNIGLSFPARATLQELEFGSVTEIDEDLFVYGSLVVGKAQGVYVASSKNGTSHMMAMTAKFTDVPESHIAVIGGTGKYHVVTGYAVIKAVGAGSKSTAGEETGNLLFNVYLS
uniref:Dirigent protein n=1 Tax=Salix viminalis TaxID=40686 RepID=A0A6N2NL22_SALVM